MAAAQLDRDILNCIYFRTVNRVTVTPVILDLKYQIYSGRRCASVGRIYTQEQEQEWRTIAYGHYNRMFQGQFYVTHKRSDILEGRYFISVYSLRQNCIENHNNGVVFAVSPLFTSEYRDTLAPDQPYF